MNIVSVASTTQRVSPSARAQPKRGRGFAPTDVNKFESQKSYENGMSRRSLSPVRKPLSKRLRGAKDPRLCDCNSVDCVFFHKGQILYNLFRNYNGDIYAAMKCNEPGCSNPRYCGKYHGDRKTPNICAREICNDDTCLYAHWECDRDLRYFTVARGVKQSIIDQFIIAPRKSAEDNTPQEDSPEEKLHKIMQIKIKMNEMALQIPHYEDSIRNAYNSMLLAVDKKAVKYMNMSTHQRKNVDKHASPPDWKRMFS